MGGAPPAQIDFDTFSKAKKLPTLCAGGGGGGGICRIPKERFFFWDVFLRLTSTIHAREVEVKDMYLPVQSRFVERHFGPLAQALD